MSRPIYRYNPTNATVVDRRGNKVYQANDRADAMRWIRAADLEIRKLSTMVNRHRLDHLDES